MAAPTPSPQPPQPPRPPQKKSSKVITLTVIGAISVLVVGYCAAQSQDDVTADCIDSSTQLADGSYAVVDDDYCDESSSHYRGSHGAFLWYYAGTRIGARVMKGSTIRPANVNISSRGGHEIQRGGFGSRSSSGG
ncbi:hypothetical protein ACIBG8_30715 [Nonomuraea sp. NPDC050556]|uniref:hypothetical protein n=1 Tax=Nonomuraea sp. NPDC050556 TaxID=3364369 RepID=UPI003789C2C5